MNCAIFMICIPLLSLTFVMYFNGRIKDILLLLSLLLFFFFETIQNFIHRFKKIDYLQIQEYEILKYIPYAHSSCVRKRIVVKLISKDY